jgi:acetyl esterase/lipase
MKSVLLCLVLLTAMLNGYSQGETIYLYPNGVPGSKGIQIQEESITTDGITRVKDITNPVLYMYQPKNKTSDAAVIICPGGGYSILAIDHEGYEIAEWFNARGITAFVLKYRLPQTNLFENAELRPLQDAQQAIRIVRKNAAIYRISPDKIGLMGFSAGGHLASTAATHFDTQFGEIIDSGISVRPDFSILIYPVITFDESVTHSGSRRNLLGETPSSEKIGYYSNNLHVTNATPPTFLISTTDDGVSPENSILYYQACQKNKVPVEMHIYEKGGHGYALKKKGLGPVETWPDRLEDWMRARLLMK